MNCSESRIEACHRLQRDGLWNKASVFRDEVRIRLRGEGMKRAEAREESWRKMIERFGPFDVSILDVTFAMQHCPPRIDSGSDPWKLIVPWQATWVAVAEVAVYDRHLRRELWIENLEDAVLFGLHDSLPKEDRDRIERTRSESAETAYRRMGQQAEDLLEWARPELEVGLKPSRCGECQNDYDDLTSEFLRRLVGSWDLLQESLRLFARR